VRGRVRLALAVLALLSAFGAGKARAFVRSTTGNSPFFWKESCVPITIYFNGFDHTSGMTQDQIVKSVTAAAHSWSADAVTCHDPVTGTVTGSPFLEIVPSFAPASTKPPPIAWDAKNSIVFRTERWSKGGVPGHDYAFDALAVTTVTARSDGHIVDADMEINGVTKNWMDLDPGVTVPFDQGETRLVFDLQNALTHEFGHFIGLDHTCFTPSPTNQAIGTDGKPRPTDDQGRLVPDCDSAPADVQRTVMYNVTPAQEISKRYLSPDDINAVCTIYGPSVEHDACALDAAPPGCAVAAPRPARGRGWALGLPAGSLVAAAALARRRRRA
jgi:hypothetical protein